MKLPAFAHARPLLFSRTGLGNLLNKIQFTFEVVPCLILGLQTIFWKVCITFSRALRAGGWVGGGVVWVEWKGGEGGGKPSQMKTHKLPTDGPDHANRSKGDHSGQG